MFIALVVEIEKEFGVEIDLANINIERFGNIQKISNVELDLHIKETLQVLMEKNF